MKKIPYGRQNITEEDIDAVSKALKADFLTQGPTILEFENSFAKYVGAKYAVAVSNGTAALHICALSLDVKPGQKVITTPITFVATANCVRYCGGEVVFADIDPETYLLDIREVRKLLEASPKGTYSGIIPVDFAGLSVDMEAFRHLADEFGLWIIEDACHAPGGYFTDSKGIKQNCGNGVYADLAIFSFHPVKHIACGEGGMVTTNDLGLYKQLLRLRSHGITKGDDSYTNSFDFANSEAGHDSYPGWYMEMQQLGFNYRLTDFQAALGISQLSRANNGIIRRRYLASVYESAFKLMPFILSQSGFINGHAYHLFVIEVKNRLGLYEYLRTRGIFAQVHYIPSHLMPYYRELGWKEGDLPNAESYYCNCLSLPMYPSMTDDEQKLVIEEISNFFK
ncbi:UDP-4-amino-4,6-dideoxy-N-acetyl-beta-L-altrosamine transaminase [Aquirufa antheringensis]|uniref:UDP-4-amino-4, 6-dideoxy-N-acetyl-beta-L-altrosamine transaminase n=1 Tax=Aquirufa antheringensis TaxID=2516559 RepID=UPI00208E3E60|nr:UDP-4-amino-4,6-dideoxy-N-acetyl-beta-L-altrosamine transaminase [Aquirufa antheringensis]USQ03357.1 UDP-4-amino-4,6-dideoxy-N-acetyl-beta-L-altrosamine transaminase [Aquirufa antheringensis]